MRNMLKAFPAQKNDALEFYVVKSDLEKPQTIKFDFDLWFDSI